MDVAGKKIYVVVGGDIPDPRKPPVTIKVCADFPKPRFELMLLVNMGLVGGKMVRIEMDSGDGEKKIWSFQVKPESSALFWEIQMDEIGEILKKMGVNFEELKPFNFTRSCGLSNDSEQREGFEVNHMDTNCVEAGNGIKFKFVMDNLTIEKGEQVGSHSHEKNVVFEIYFYLEDPFYADVCGYDEEHESRPGMRHVVAVKMILCK